MPIQSLVMCAANCDDESTRPLRRRPARGSCAASHMPSQEHGADLSQLFELVLPYTGIRYIISSMIHSFGDKATEALFRDERVRQFEGIARRAKRKLEAINAASRLDDLAIPPSNRLEKLKGDLKEFHSIRINDQWRVIFKWVNNEPHGVRIVDYH